MVDGTTRAASSALTPATAVVMLANVACSVAAARGFGTRRSVISVRIASVPSEPIEQLRQVVADDVLHRLRPGADDLAGRQDRLQRQHVPARGAVLHGTWSAGALGDVAAECRDLQAGGIRRVEEPACLDRILQLIGQHVGLDDGELIVLIDLEDAIEPLHRQQDTAAHGHGASRVPRAGPAHDQGHAVSVTQARDGGDLVDAGRQEHQVRGCSAQERVRSVVPA